MLFKLPPQTKQQISRAWLFTKNWVFPILLFALAAFLAARITLDKNHGKNTLKELNAWKKKFVDSTAVRDKRLNLKDQLLGKQQDTIAMWRDYNIQQEKHYNKIIKDELAKNKFDRGLKIDAIDTMPVGENVRLFERNFTPADSNQGNGN